MTRSALTAALIVLALTVGGAAQDAPDAAAPVVTKAWAILTSALASSSLPEQAAAARALMTNETPRARNLIEGILQDKSRQIRSSVMWMMPSGPAMLPLIAEALQDRDLEVRRAAIQQLGRINDPRALALLQDVILQGDAETIDYAVGSAERLRAAGLQILLNGLDNGGERTREGRGSNHQRARRRPVQTAVCRESRSKYLSWAHSSIGGLIKNSVLGSCASSSPSTMGRRGGFSSVLWTVRTSWCGLRRQAAC